MDIFTDTGKEEWDELDREEAEVELHAPECKTFSRARGRPFKINGEWYIVVHRHSGMPRM